MNVVECVHKNRLLAEFEIALSEYATELNKTGRGFDFARTALYRGRLDRMEEEITAHCIEHGCDPDWVATRLRR